MFAEAQNFPLQCGFNVWRNHARYISSKRRDFPHRAGRKEGVLFRCDQGDRFDFRIEVLFRQRHPELELEVLKDAQSAHDDLRAGFAAKVNSETAVTGHFDFWVLPECLPHQLHAFIRCEHQ